jgi:predicted transposase YbfD/YdcC
MEPIIAIFQEVRDPRDVNSRHLVSSMLFIALAASLCGAKSAVDIADFGEANAAMLGEIVDLPHGIPSHDSFSRLFRLLDPAELATALARFGQALRAALGLGAPRGVVAVDGKSLRRGYEHGRAFMPPLMVSVWDAETRLSIAVQRAEGGDEIGATLAVLKSLVLKGCIVTADALHCHPRMAEAVRATGAHYALGLKGNHGPLHRAAVEAFAKADATGKLAVHERRESGHGRQERRRVSVIARPPDALPFRVWPRSPASRPSAKAGPAGARPRRATSRSPNACRRDAYSRSRARIGASRTISTGNSTSSSPRTTLERARTTDPKTSPSSGEWLSISCAHIPSTAPSPEK